MGEIQNIIVNWFDEIIALQATMPISKVLIDLLQHIHHDQFINYIKKYCKFEEDLNTSKIIYTIPENEFSRYSKYHARLKEIKTTNTIIPRMFIVTLVCQFDAYIGKLVAEVCKTLPTILKNSERKLTFDQILNFNSIDDVKEYLIGKEVESVLRDSHDEQISWFENKLKLNLRENQELLCRFFEITERRNLFTHNDGIVNENYIKNCKRFNININGLKNGEKLSADLEYYNNAVNTLIEIGTKLGHIIWRKINKSEIQETESSINNIAFQLIKHEQYDLSINIIEFALNSYKKFDSSLNMYMLIINLAQCYLWKNDSSKALDIINSYDWSACNNDFLIAKCTIENNYCHAIELLKKESSISKESLLDWPLFKEFRKTHEFHEFFKNKYGKTVEEVYQDIYPEEIEAKLNITASG
jgi:hypothetical protein